MSHHTKMPDDPKLRDRLARLEKHDSRVEHVFRRILHNIERIIAAITLLVLVAALASVITLAVTPPQVSLQTLISGSKLDQLELLLQSNHFCLLPDH